MKRPLHLTSRLVIFAALMSVFVCQVSVLGPPNLISKMRNYQTGTSGGLDYQLGNFGEIPYGKTVVGYVFYNKNLDGKNTWCDFENTSTPLNVEKDPDGEYSPIFLVDYSDDCSLVRKAYNARARGARVMLLVSNDKTFKDYKNVDDPLGNRVDIPTVIIRSEEGEEIKRFLSENQNEKVVMSIKFSGMKSGEGLTVELFMRSDDLKSLHFFKEFKQYFEKLKNKITFVPRYKYYRYSWEVTSNLLGSEETQAPCVKDTKYCAHENHNLKIFNPRVALMENIRQSCIYTTFKNDNMELYWNYMINFSETCADPNNPLFTEACAIDMMKYTGINVDTINKCMKEDINNSPGPIENDYSTFRQKKVIKIPEIMFNGVKYKGSWLSKYIFDSICSGFIDDDGICASPKPQDFSGDSGIGAGGVFLIIVVCVVTMVVLLICYRRIVNKSLEASLNEKIQTQTIHSLGQYQVFKDESTGRKTVDVTKL